MGEKVSFKWEDFQNIVTKSFTSLRNEEDFFDVTLVTDDQVQISAHKLILSSSSSFMKSILRRNKHQHPLVYLSGVNSSELLSVIEFIYNGQVAVEKQHLESFLRVSEKLKIVGIVKNDNADKNVENSRAAAGVPKSEMDFFQFDPNQFGHSNRPAPPFPPQPPVTRPAAQFGSMQDNRIFLMKGATVFPPVQNGFGGSPQSSAALVAPDTRPVIPSVTLNENLRDTATPTKSDKDKTEDAKTPGAKKDDERSKSPSVNEVQVTKYIQTIKDIELVDKKLAEFSTKSADGMFTCKICQKTSTNKSNHFFHIETHMDGLFFQCELCNKTTKTRNAMKKHYHFHHKKAPFTFATF